MENDVNRGQGRFWPDLQPLTRICLIVAALALVAATVSIADSYKGKKRGDLTLFSLSASRVLLQGENPYVRDNVGRNYKYLPTNIIVLMPMAPLPDHVAQGVWFAIGLGLILYCIHLHSAMLQGTKVPWWVTFLALAVTFRLIWTNLKLGQWNLPVYSLAFIGLAHLHRHRLRGALMVGLAAALKYMPAFFIIYFATRREWKKAVAVLASTVLWILVIPALVLGPSRHIELLQEFVQASTQRVEEMTLGEATSSLSLRSTIYRTLSPIAMEVRNETFYANLFNLSRPAAAAIADGIAGAIAIAAAIFTYRLTRAQRKSPPETTLLLIGGWFLVFLMISPGVRHAQMLTLFTPCFALFSLLASPRVSPAMKRVLGIGMVIVFVLLTGPSAVIKGARYNYYFELYGSMAGAVLLLAGLTVAGLFHITRPASTIVRTERRETFAA